MCKIRRTEKRTHKAKKKPKGEKKPKGKKKPKGEKKPKGKKKPPRERTKECTVSMKITNRRQRDDLSRL